MRSFLGLMLLVCVTGAYAQNVEEPEVIKAEASIEKLRNLVQAGVVPRNQLDKAENELADAKDSAFLRRTLYGQELTADQADEMIAAAGRRFDRRKQAFDDAEKLVKAGVAPEISLSPYISDMDMARKECDLADSRAKLTIQLAEMANAEESFERHLAQQGDTPAEGLTDRFEGDGTFTTAMFTRVETAYESRFGKPLPVSAMGETAVHRSLGFDHRGRVDVALYPDTQEGVWLREYLAKNKIPYIAFRHAVPGKATGAHIHMGPMSTRIRNGG